MTHYVTKDPLPYFTEDPTLQVTLCYTILYALKCCMFQNNVRNKTRAGGGVAIREQRSRARSWRGGVSENQIAGAAGARLFFLTAVAIAVAIAIATRPFKFHEISVSNTSSSFVSSIHSLDKNSLNRCRK